MAAVAPELPDASRSAPLCKRCGADLALSSTTPFSVTRVAISSVCWPRLRAGSGAVQAAVSVSGAKAPHAAPGSVTGDPST